MPGQTFERDMVHAWNEYANRRGRKLIAYRHLQTRYQPQLFDVLVDTRGMDLYLALECKSIDTNSVDRLYFKKHFSWTKGVCQIQRETDWLNMSGRNGFLVVEARRGVGKRTTCFFVPWRVVEHAFKVGEPGIWPDQLTWTACCDKRQGKYIFDDEFIDELVKTLDTSGREVKRSWKRKR
jgi:hypothetical protein